MFDSDRVMQKSAKCRGAKRDTLFAGFQEWLEIVDPGIKPLSVEREVAHYREMLIQNGRMLFGITVFQVFGIFVHFAAFSLRRRGSASPGNGALCINDGGHAGLYVADTYC